MKDKLDMFLQSIFIVATIVSASCLVYVVMFLDALRKGWLVQPMFYINIGDNMLEKVKNGADGAIDVGIKLISLSIILQIIFGPKVAFLTGDVIGSILGIVWTLGNGGLAGIIAALIIWRLLDKDIVDELKD